MKRFVPILAMLALVLAGPALAQAPQTISYQGVLTDGAGNLLPNGFYDLTFRIYNVPVAGVALYTEAHTGVNHVQVATGGFSVILGSLSPITLPFDGQYYLGIQVGVAPELAPRIALAASPYALGLILPFTLSATAGTPLITGFEYGVSGGGMHYMDPSGNQTIRLEPDTDGSGGYFQVARNTNGSGFAGFIVDGNVGGTQEPSALLYGSAVTAGIDLSQTGDASVLLPTGSIDANEIMDEPGVAQGHVSGGSVSPPVGGPMGDIVTVTITTPAAGYIVVEADAQHGIAGSATATLNYSDYQIDETAGGSTDGAHYFASGFNGAAGARNFFTWSPISIRRTYFKAGLNARTSPSGAYCVACNPP